MDGLPVVRVPRRQRQPLPSGVGGRQVHPLAEHRAQGSEAKEHLPQGGWMREYL